MWLGNVYFLLRKYILMGLVFSLDKRAFGGYRIRIILTLPRNSIDVNIGELANQVRLRCADLREPRTQKPPGPTKIHTETISGNLSD